MPASVKGAVELRKALREFTPDLAKETQKEIALILKPITNKARGFIPSTAPLSGWAKGGEGAWGNRSWSTGDAKRGIGYKTTPSKPNRSGWRSLARIVNASVSGSIYETAGRVNPQGRPQAPLVKVVAPRHANFGKTAPAPCLATRFAQRPGFEPRRPAQAVGWWQTPTRVGRW